MGSIISPPRPVGPTMPPPSAHPAILGNQQIALSQAVGSDKAKAAEGMGFDSTIQTSPQGLAAPSTGKATLLGQ